MIRCSKANFIGYHSLSLLLVLLRGTAFVITTLYSVTGHMVFSLLSSFLLVLLDLSSIESIGCKKTWNYYQRWRRTSSWWNGNFGWMGEKCLDLSPYLWWTSNLQVFRTVHNHLQNDPWQWGKLLQYWTLDLNRISTYRYHYIHVCMAPAGFKYFNASL